ncbi:hypothetical protein L3Y34_008345 [Caenorhabditis briggsae]|uniref:Kinesin light chain n=1 Tax=Caenorhabditis briggsae TaxID=6238 RepID=A0AAE9A2U7_CAEBR|nr:hypothetical protein L3Y34_008345 [Caenorhabditis briggsae]
MANFEEGLTTDLKTIQQRITSLRDEHNNCSNTIEANSEGVDSNEPSLSKEIQIQLNENMEKLLDNENDVSMLLMVAQLLHAADVQKAKSRDAEKLLIERNDWLVEELAETQSRLQESERINGQLEEEVKHLRFLDTTKTIRTDIQSSTLADETSRPLAIDTLQDLGFGPEDDENDINHNLRDGQPNCVNNNPSPNRLVTLNTLVIQYMKDGRYDIAGPLGKQALEDLINVHGRNHPDVATMMNLLAMVYRDQQKYKEAAQYLEDALAIRESCFGENHQTTAANLNNLAIVLGKRGKFKEAEPLCRRALKIRETVLGEDHVEVARQLTNLGLLCLNMGKYEEVEACHKKALKIYEAKLGTDDPNTIKTKNNLASIFLKLGKYDEAESLYKQILTRAHETQFGTKHDSKPIWKIAEEREEKKQKGELDTSLVGPVSVSYLESEHILSALTKLSALYRKQGEFEAADYLENVAVRTKTPEEGSRVDSHFLTTSSNEDSRVRVANTGIRSKLLSALGFNI